MENIEETPKNHPKPSEEVQMNIETVIPDTEKLAQTEQPTAPTQPKQPTSSEEPAAQEETGDANTDISQEEENKKHTAGTQKGENDARDAVETVSP